MSTKDTRTPATIAAEIAALIAGAAPRRFCITYSRDGAGLFVLARDAGEIKDRLQEMRHDTHIAPTVRLWTNPPAGEQTRQLGMLPLDADLATITALLAPA